MANRLIEMLKQAKTPEERRQLQILFSRPGSEAEKIRAGEQISKAVRYRTQPSEARLQKNYTNWFSVAGDLYADMFGGDVKQAQRMALALQRANPHIKRFYRGMTLNLPPAPSSGSPYISPSAWQAVTGYDSAALPPPQESAAQPAITSQPAAPLNQPDKEYGSFVARGGHKRGGGRRGGASRPYGYAQAQPATTTQTNAPPSSYNVQAIQSIGEQKPDLLLPVKLKAAEIARNLRALPGQLDKRAQDVQEARQKLATSKYLTNQYLSPELRYVTPRTPLPGDALPREARTLIGTYTVPTPQAPQEQQQAQPPRPSGPGLQFASEEEYRRFVQGTPENEVRNIFVQALRAAGIDPTGIDTRDPEAIKRVAEEFNARLDSLPSTHIALLKLAGLIEPVNEGENVMTPPDTGGYTGYAGYGNPYRYGAGRYYGGGGGRRYYGGYPYGGGLFSYGPSRREFVRFPTWLGAYQWRF